MLTIQQMMRAVRDLQTRVAALEAAKVEVPVETPPVRRGRPAKVVEEVVEASPGAPVEVTL